MTKWKYLRSVLTTYIIISDFLLWSIRPHDVDWKVMEAKHSAILPLCTDGGLWIHSYGWNKASPQQLYFVNIRNTYTHMYTTVTEFNARLSRGYSAEFTRLGSIHQIEISIMEFNLAIRRWAIRLSWVTYDICCYENVVILMTSAPKVVGPVTHVTLQNSASDNLVNITNPFPLSTWDVGYLANLHRSVICGIFHHLQHKC